MPKNAAGETSQSSNGLFHLLGIDARSLPRETRNAGPGSPTYALRQWRESLIPKILHEKLISGGAVTFASAAALTLGIATVPVGCQ